WSSDVCSSDLGWGRLVSANNIRLQRADSSQGASKTCTFWQGGDTMRYLGQAAFFLTLLAAGLASVLSARRGWGPGRLLGESWPRRVLGAVPVLTRMGGGWLCGRLARPRPTSGAEEPPAGTGAGPTAPGPLPGPVGCAPR